MYYDSEKIDSMREAGRINREAIEYGFELAQPGLTLLELDQELECFIRNNDCEPAFKGYNGFPFTACLSVNDVLVHGLPNSYIVQDGDILTIDIGSRKNGWCVDAADTLPIGEASNEAVGIIGMNKTVLSMQLDKVKDGVSLYEIASMSNILMDIYNGPPDRERVLGEKNIMILPQLGGHQIGKTIHEDPFIPAVLDKSLSKPRQQLQELDYKNTKLHAGQTICIEPVVKYGTADTILDADGWTIRSKDKELSSHVEKCILVTETGYEILS